MTPMRFNKRSSLLSNEELSDKQLAFIREYLKSRNATDAAIRAGYSSKGASVQGTRLLANDKIRARIDEANQRLQQKFDVTRERLIEELAAMAFSDITKVMAPGATGMKLRPWDEMDEFTRRAIQSINESDTQMGSSTGVRMYDKIRAIKLLGDNLGLWKHVRASESNQSTPADALRRVTEILRKRKVR